MRTGHTLPPPRHREVLTGVAGDFACAHLHPAGRPVTQDDLEACATYLARSLMTRCANVTRSSPSLLPDHHLGGLDDDHDRIADLQLEALCRTTRNGGHHLVSGDLHHNLRHDPSERDRLDDPRELIARTQFHDWLPFRAFCVAARDTTPRARQPGGASACRVRDVIPPIGSLTPVNAAC